MEWYYGRGDEDVTVPEDEEGLRSWGDRWPSWVGNCSSSSEVEQLHHPILSSQQSDGWDVHLKDLPKIQEADDIFFDSLFKVGEGSENIAQTSSWNDVMTFDFGDHVQDTTNDVSSAPHFSHQQELEAEIRMFEQQSDQCEDTNEYISMDESALLELQNLTQQLAETTRVCFRDSLYRLAENSRYQTECSQNGKQDMYNCKSISRSGPSRSHESHSEDMKSIDRTVATLLFTAMQLCNSTSATPDLDNKANSYWCDPCSSALSLPGGDGEVPTFD
ncbi:protein LNK4-like [Salvia splendens]|nr:protein LNK4-like [Salvia splendens]